MSHKTPTEAKTYEQSKPQHELLGRKEVVTFSQCGEYYDYSKFTPKTVLKRKDFKSWV